MSKRLWAVMTAGTIWVGLISGQGCPGFYEEQVASDDGGATGGDSSGNTDTGGSDTDTGTGGSDTDTGGSGGATSVVDVGIDDAKFIPKSVTISVGQAVRWTNHMFTPHAIRSGNPEDSDKGELFRSESLAIGASFQYTFTEPGTYYYHCEYMYRLEGMRDATVIVAGSSNE